MGINITLIYNAKPNSLFPTYLLYNFYCLTSERNCSAVMDLSGLKASEFI